jgi:hypothetical protein
LLLTGKVAGRWPNRTVRARSIRVQGATSHDRCSRHSRRMTCRLRR